MDIQGSGPNYHDVSIVLFVLIGRTWLADRTGKKWKLQ